MLKKGLKLGKKAAKFVASSSSFRPREVTIRQEAILPWDEQVYEIYMQEVYFPFGILIHPSSWSSSSIGCGSVSIAPVINCTNNFPIEAPAFPLTNIIPFPQPYPLDSSLIIALILQQFHALESQIGKEVNLV